MTPAWNVRLPEVEQVLSFDPYGRGLRGVGPRY